MCTILSLLPPAKKKNLCSKRIYTVVVNNVDLSQTLRVQILILPHAIAV